MGRIVWATVADYQNTGHAITFFTPCQIRLKRNIRLKFGVKEVNCRTDQLVVGEADDLLESNCAETGVAFISTGLKKTLGIPTNLTYQLILKEDSITVGPTIGLLLGTKLEQYTPEFMTENYADRMGIYPQIGGLIVAYSTVAVDWRRQTVKGLMYQQANRAWIPIVTTIPKVTYRRHVSQPNFRVFRRNLVKNNGILFNSIRFSKWRVHQILKNNPLMSRYLPDTILLESYKQFMEFIIRFPKVILKPACGSRGKGILVIERIIKNSQEKFLLTDYRHKKITRKQSLVSPKTLQSILETLSIFEPKKYICQRFINLATIKGSPFDIRVLMQKDADQKWHCSGIECRVAHPNKEITNLAAGGSAMSLEEAVNFMEPPVKINKLYTAINHACTEYCFWMDWQKKQHYAEFGIDVGIDKGGNIWLIEANFRPGYKGFKILDCDLYLEIGYRPFRYATVIQGFYI